MATQRLVATERFYYGGCNVEQGEEFDADEIDVPLLIHAHTPKATILELGGGPAKKVAVREAPAEAEPEAKPVRYKRRDMKAED